MRGLWIVRPPVWRENRNLRWYVRMGFVSTFGNWQQSTALTWLVYKTTGHASALAIAGLIGLGQGIISRRCGRLADRRPTRTIMLVSQTALMMLAVTLCVLRCTGSTRLWPLYAILGVAGAFSGLNGPAEKKLIPQLIEKKEQRYSAVAINAMGQSGAWVLGGSAAGFFIGWWGVTPLFFINAISYGGVVAYLLWLPAGRDVPSPEENTAHGEESQNNETQVRPLLLVVAIMSLFNTAGAVMQPLIGQKLGGVHGYGLLSMSNGIGALSGSIFCLLQLKKKKPTVQGQIALAAASSALLACVGLSPKLILAMIFMAAGAAMSQMLRTETDALIQSVVPLHQLGRVNGRLLAITTTGPAIGNWSAGFILVPAYGITAASAGLNAAGLVSCGPVWLHFKRRANRGKPE